MAASAFMPPQAGKPRRVNNPVTSSHNNGLSTAVTEHNLRDLRTKQDRTGHDLPPTLALGR